MKMVSDLIHQDKVPKKVKKLFSDNALILE